jgi:hypothetical protein
MKYFLILLIPILLLANIEYNNKTEFGQDPNYAYLFNALNLAAYSGSVGMYPHPGTTAIEFSAFVLKITYSVRKTTDDFPTDVLKNPQYYIKVVVWSFAVLNSLMIFLLGFFILKMTNELIYSLLFQSIPMFSHYAIEWGFQLFCPEPLLFGSAIVFVMLFLWKFYFNKSFDEISIPIFKKWKISIDKLAILFGVLLGFCLATKINTMPLILLPLLFIPRFKSKCIFLVIVFASFILFTLPIAHLYGIMIAWYLGIVGHTDLYGGGQAGFINPVSLYKNFLETFKYEPLILFIILISLLVVVKQVIQKRYDIHLKILSALVLVQVAFLFMVLKHFHLHYFIPMVPVLAINLFIILEIFKLSRLLKIILIAPFIAVSIYLNKDIKKYIPELYSTDYPRDGINIFSYKSQSPVYALKFGDDQSLNANSSRLKKIYGDVYFYDITTKYITTWNDTISLDSLLSKNKKVYLNALDLYMKELPPPFEIRFISEGLYLVYNQKSDSLVVK